MRNFPFAFLLNLSNMLLFESQTPVTNAFGIVEFRSLISESTNH